MRPPRRCRRGSPTWGRAVTRLPSTPLQKKIQDQRQNVMAEFKQAHEFLREREQHLLEKLEALQQELTEGREKYKSRGVTELARLALVISELETKAQQPAAELLQVRCLRGGRSLSPVPTWDPGRAATSQAVTFSTEMSGESPPPAPPPPVVTRAQEDVTCMVSLQRAKYQKPVGGDWKVPWERKGELECSRHTVHPRHDHHGSLASTLQGKLRAARAAGVAEGGRLLPGRSGGDEQGFLWDGEQAGCPGTLPEGGSFDAKGERLELEWKQHRAAFLLEPPWTFPLRARRRLWWPGRSAVEPPTSSRKMLSWPAAWPQETQRGRLSRTLRGAACCPSLSILARGLGLAGGEGPV